MGDKAKKQMKKSEKIAMTVALTLLGLIAFYAVFELALALLFNQGGATVEWDDGVYRCEEYGVTFSVNGYDEKISIDGDDYELTVWRLHDWFLFHTIDVNSGPSVSCTVKRVGDGAYDLIIGSVNEIAKKCGFGEDDVLHFVKVGDIGAETSAASGG